MAKTLAQTLLGAMENGEAVMEDIRIARRISQDKIAPGVRSLRKIDALNPPELEVKVVSVTDAGAGSKTFRLASTNGYLPPFEAGQYLNIFTELEGIRTSRPYSICSSPRQRAYYEITVARAQNGFVSDYFLDKVRVGDVFTANGPAGVFKNNPVFHKKTAVFLAGGSGITPFISMTREALETGSDREIYFLYGSRNPDTLMFHEELKAYDEEYPNFHYHLVLSDDVEGFTGEKGFLNAGLIKKLVPGFNDCTYYICGPQIMNEFCQCEVEGMGIPQKQIRREMFGAAGDITKEPGWPSYLNGSEIFKMRVGDREVDARADESLLAALERGGIRVNVCCRSGECSFCRVKLVSGKVYIAPGMMRRAADEKYDYIHSCKAYPIEDLEIKL